MPIHYTPLDVARNEIRVIRFTRNQKRPIEVELVTICRDDKPEYQCLSYVWGDGDPIVIVVNGLGTTVTPNLGEALERLEKEENLTQLWVDAICINQEDMVEKCHQVSMMGK